VFIYDVCVCCIVYMCVSVCVMYDIYVCLLMDKRWMDDKKWIDRRWIYR